jgi:hypothetical protein
MTEEDDIVARRRKTLTERISYVRRQRIPVASIRYSTLGAMSRGHWGRRRRRVKKKEEEERG